MPLGRRRIKRLKKSLKRGRMTGRKVVKIAKSVVKKEQETKAYDDYYTIATGMTSTAVYPILQYRLHLLLKFQILRI